MNKKGFTLVELILVLTIIALVTAMTIPGILKALSSSKEEGGKAIEKLLLHNLEIYNTDYEQDLWCLEDSDCSDTNNTITISFNDLLRVNNDINMGECLLKDENSLSIKRNSETGKYTYKATIVCSANFPKKDNIDYEQDNSKILKSTYQNDTNIGIYYKTP